MPEFWPDSLFRSILETTIRQPKGPTICYLYILHALYMCLTFITMTAHAVNVGVRAILLQDMVLKRVISIDVSPIEITRPNNPVNERKRCYFPLLSLHYFTSVHPL